MDPRNKKLADTLVNFSTKLQPGEKVLIEAFGESTHDLAKEIVKAVKEAGGVPFVSTYDKAVLRNIIMNSTDEAIELFAKYDLARMKEMDCYVGVRGDDNVNEFADISSEDMSRYMRLYSNVVHGERVNNTRWVVLRYPNNAMAQLAKTSLESFTDFYYDVCNLDYAKMDLAMDALVDLMNRTDKVRITGQGTDFSFSIKDIPAIKCAGEMNIPDGEVFTAPVKDSVNGKLSFNAPAVYLGTTYENIVLEFKDGKIVDATANETEKINGVFDTDEGARYVGEFAIGLNPFITKPMMDTLFDEKIAGSFHFTPGKCYDEAPNGNKSSIHWDLVCIQTPEYGGGEMYFDDVLIRKDGLFVIDELLGLNPENLK